MELNRRMTFEEMEQHMVENTTKIPSKTAVGRYAKSLGYTTYRPMVNKKVVCFYVNDKIKNA